MKVVICGAGGQLGQSLQQTQPSWLTVSAVTRSTLDVTNPEQVAEQIQNIRPDIIINASAYTQVDRAENEPEQAFALNAGGVRHLAEVARSINARIIHVSTDFVFDGTNKTPYHVDDVCKPLNVYGASKLAGEDILRQVLPSDHLVIRTSWLYSNYGANFVKTMLNLMRQGSALRVVQDQVGSPTWAKGLANVIWTMTECESFGRTLHWCDQGATSWYEFAVAIQEEAVEMGLLKQSVSIQPISSSEYPVSAKRPAFSVMDCEETLRVPGVNQAPWRVHLREMLSEQLKR